MRCKPFVVLVLFAVPSIPSAATGQEVIDLEQAKQDPDFLAQGEYLGEGIWPGGEKSRIGAQVIAQGDHKFRAVFYRGGLPGDGWKRGDDRLLMDGKLDGKEVALTGKELFAGRIVDSALTVQNSGGQQTAKLTRIERKSPTLEAKPPKGAVVLFDGSNVDHFPGATLTDMKTLQAGCNLKEKYKIAQLHLEFLLSWKPKARGQGRSNSGVYLAGIPEIQVLDSFGLEGANNECGGFYGRREPDVNMCFPPLAWQTYDVEFSKPPTRAGGEPNENILATVRHNGVIVHENYDTGKKDWPPSGMNLQAHGNRVQYRNIWLVEAE
jgi:hypothetical protein